MLFSIFQGAAQVPLQQPPAPGLHHPQLLLIFSLHPALLQPFIWPPILLTWAAERASCATLTCLIIPHVPEAIWLPCRVTLGWVTAGTIGCRVALLLPLSPQKLSCLRGLHPWSQECRLHPHCLAMGRWKPMVANWGPSQPLSFSMSCKQATLPPPLLLHICLVVATCNRAPTMPSPFTTLTICMDTISLPPLGWQQAQRNWPHPKALYSVPPLPMGLLERGNIFQQGWIMGCTWSAPHPATSKQPVPVITGSMGLSRVPPHRCLCTWFNQQAVSLESQTTRLCCLPSWPRPNTILLLNL